MHLKQEIRFCSTADGVRIAYALVGQGPTIVKAPNWLTHLEYEWQTPIWRHWWEELARDYTVIRFDQRGCGLSDRNVPEISFDLWVQDLEAVVDHAGLDRFALLGISQGGPAAIEYSARHPGKVSHLIIYGAYARGWIKRGRQLQEREAMLTLMREGWGRDNPAYRQLFTLEFMPEATPDQISWFNELQKISTSPENAVRTSMAAGQIDVLDRLQQVSAPTLVLHALGDERVAFEEGRQIASLIPGAHLVPLESRNHLTLQDEPAWTKLINEVRHFLATGAPAPREQAVRAAAATPDSLSEREIEVLLLLADGRSNQEIADALVISTHTVANHVKSILGKTASANRTEAASYAFRAGLMSSPTQP